MTWKQITLVCFALILASQAYRQIYNNPGYYYTGIPQPTLERRADTRSVDVYQADRADGYRAGPSERSIPFRSSSQRVQAQEWTRLNDSPEPRHGNLSVKNAFTKTYPSITSRRGTPVDPESVVFPGPTSRRSMFEPEVSPDCEQNGICETVPNYPHEYVNNLLSKMDDFQNKFNLDVETPEIAQRRGPGEESLELCQHREKIIYPKAAKNTQGKWVFVINKNDDPIQGFKGELCVNEDQPCSEIAYFSDKYKATCKQKRIERAIWSLDKDGHMVKESIPLPSCCTCIVKVVS